MSRIYLTASSCFTLLTLLGPLSGYASIHHPYPEDENAIEQLKSELLHTVYAPVIRNWEARGTSLTVAEIERLWRMSRKAEWRSSDSLPLNAEPEKRIKLLTNRDWRAYQWGGPEESADPAAPFVIQANDSRPKGMPTGSYALSSGKIGHWYPTTRAMLRNEKPVLFEIEFQQLAHDGRVVIQQKTPLEANESLGWDGRFEYQTGKSGDLEIVLTQGAMELPINLIGAAPNAPLSPRVSQHNQFRSRHLFRLREWVPAKRNHLAKLIVRDVGSILNFTPTTELRYIQADSKGKLQHAHGYGENFFPDPKNPQMPWRDEEGFLWRVFDMVTRETTIEKTTLDRVERFTIPTETRAVAIRMDKANSSQRDPDSKFVFLTSNFINDSITPLPATIRYAFDTRGKAVELREILEDGSVRIQTDSVPQNAPALLNEGLNFFEQVVTLGMHSYFLSTNSGGEYTSGGLPSPNQRFYGTYLWYRKVEEGRIGPYRPVMNEAGSDALDMFKEITQMYGASWGIGRAQIFGAQANSLWAKAHMVDVDLLPEDSVRFPHSGYPPENDVFTHAYRRHQIEIPILVKEERGLPTLEVADPQVQADLVEWRKRIKHSAKPMQL